MANLIYSLPTDNKAGSVVPTLDTGTANASYPLTNLYDTIVAKPFATTTTGAVVVKWDFGSAQRLDIVSLLIHNIPAGTVVNFQGNAADAWGAPTLNGVITIATYGNDGFPAGHWLDLTGVSGYTTSGFRYWRLSIANPSQVTRLGEIWMGTTKRTLAENLRVGPHFPLSRNAIVHRTDYGVPLVYDTGVTERAIVGSVTTTATGYSDLIDLWKAAKGPVNNFLVIPDPAVNDSLVVRWYSPFDPQIDTTNYIPIPIEWIADSRGAAL